MYVNIYTVEHHYKTSGYKTTCILDIQRSSLIINLITDKVIILLILYIFLAQNHFQYYLYNFDWLK